MLTDVVVDTNIFCHAQMPQDTQQIYRDAKEFIEALLAVNTQLCVDGILDLERPGSSKIGWEYFNRIPNIGFGYNALVEFLSTDRFRMNVSDNVGNHRSFVVRLIGDPRDRTMVFVAFNTAEKIVVSHDKDDYAADVRSEIRKKLGVTIEAAVVTTARL